MNVWGIAINRADAARIAEVVRRGPRYGSRRAAFYRDGGRIAVLGILNVDRIEHDVFAWADEVERRVARAEHQPRHDRSPRPIQVLNGGLPTLGKGAR